MSHRNNRYNNYGIIYFIYNTIIANSNSISIFTFKLFITKWPWIITKV